MSAETVESLWEILGVAFGGACALFGMWLYGKVQDWRDSRKAIRARLSK